MFRFVFDIYVFGALIGYQFAYDLAIDLVLYIDVLPFIGILLFHRKNFKQSKQVVEDTDKTSSEQEEYLNFGSMNESEDVIQLEPAGTTIVSTQYSMSSSSPKRSKNQLSLS